jgi:hypothetical protein
MFLTNKRQVGMKLEATPYTAQTDMTSTDYNFRADNVKYSANILETKRKYATGDFASFSSVMGKEECTISFSQDLAWSGTAATPPEWGKALIACGWKETIYGATGVGYALSSINAACPVTVEVAENSPDDSTALIVRASGCMGAAKLTLAQVGAPLKLETEFKGALNSVFDTTKTTHGTFDNVQPDAVLASTVTAMGYTMDMDKVSIDTGTKVENVVDPSRAQGICGCVITGREPKMTLDPYLDSTASKDILGKWVANTQASFAMTVGAHLQVLAPSCQITKAFDSADRNGVVVNTLNLALLRATASTDAEVEILQGSKT